MHKSNKIPSHSMEDWDCGIYLKSFSEASAGALSYDIAQAHRHDFYYCVLLDEGTMELEVDFENIQLWSRSAFMSYPGQVHQVKGAVLKRGWFLALDPSGLDIRLVGALDQCLAEVICFEQPAEASTALFQFAEQLYGVYSDKTMLFREQVAHSMVTALVYRILAAYLTLERLDLTPHSLRSIEIAKEFRQTLRREYRTLKRPGEYAAKMHISAGHLNDTVKAVTGLSVTRCIQQEVMREAKRLVYFSGRSINEIADDLGFEDVQYFNRLFRKLTGMNASRFGASAYPKR